VSDHILLVECNTDALAAAELGESVIAAGGPGDFSDEQMDELRRSPGPIYVLPDDGSLDGEAPRRWVFDLYPKALLCPAEYGEGLEDLAQLLHKRGKGEARKVLEDLKAKAVDALELELREVEENSADGSHSLATYRRTKARILPLVTRLEDEGERDAALRDVARRAGLSLRSLRNALDDSEEAPESEGTVAQEEPPEPSVDPGQIEELVGRPGVLERYVEDVARIHGVVNDREILRLQKLVADGAQLEPLANGRPAGANLVLIAEAGRGKNHTCDAVATGLPEEFYTAFESASAKSLYYRAENDPALLKHCWIYPSEAEATDELVEMFRPLISGGRASHLTVNKNAEGRNTAQELLVEGPVTVTIPTVRNKLDTQLQSRMLVSELPDYDGRVAAHSRAFSRLLLPNQAGEDYTPKVRAWKAALRSLTAIRRVVFDLDCEEFCFDSDTVSHGARLWGNFLGLMLAHAWLEQRNRDIIELSSGELAVAATPEDYEAAYNIFKATCERSVVNLSDTHRKILDAVYDLKQESDTTEGFSHRKIAERAGVHHSTIGEHRTYLVKSVKLLRETESGMLDLVADAEPTWWNDDDLLEGFPHPEQVWRWWDEKESHSAPESARHARHSEDESHNALSHAENPGGHSTRHPSATSRQPEDEDLLAGTESGVADETPASESPVDKPDSNGSEPLAGVAGASEDGREKFSATDSRRLTAEEVQRVKHLIREGMAPHLARAEVLGYVEEELNL
jgi:hypothetical protein